MEKLQTLEELRTKKEVKDYFKQLGKEITDEELNALKQSYDKAQENNSALTMQQLDDVAGGGAHIVFEMYDAKRFKSGDIPPYDPSCFIRTLANNTASHFSSKDGTDYVVRISVHQTPEPADAVRIGAKFDGLRRDINFKSVKAFTTITNEFFPGLVESLHKYYGLITEDNILTREDEGVPRIVCGVDLGDIPKGSINTVVNALNDMLHGTKFTANGAEDDIESLREFIHKSVIKSKVVNFDYVMEYGHCDLNESLRNLDDYLSRSHNPYHLTAEDFKEDLADSHRKARTEIVK